MSSDDPDTPNGEPVTAKEEEGDGGALGVIVTLGAIIAVFLLGNQPGN